MAKNTRIIFGLGNPGEAYKNTRHNIGFMVIDALAEKAKIALSSDNPGQTRSEKLFSLLSQGAMASEGAGTYRNTPMILVKPLTFMNRSGQVVKKFVKKFQITPQDILVIYDDISLPTGTIRIREKGGAAGHNGVQDIIDELETAAFPRIRIGVGNDFERGQQAEYVLSPFMASEEEIVQKAIKQAANASITFVRDGLTVTMNRYNRRTS